MGGLLNEIGKRLAERWISALALPGLLYVAVTVTARVLGQEHALSPDRLMERLQGWASPRTSVADVVVAVAALLFGAVVAGIAAQSTGAVVERLWLAEDWRAWPAPLRRAAHRRVEARRRRWARAEAAHAEATHQVQQIVGRATRASGPQTDTVEARARDRLSLTEVQLLRISAEMPDRPTWIGDRVAAVGQRTESEYLLDLPTLWPALWLTLPDSARSDLGDARAALNRAAVLGGWALLYVAVAALWWPAGVVGLVLGNTARRRGRAATDAYAQFVEAAVRLYTIDVARQLGIDHQGPLDAELGWDLTCRLQGRSHLLKLTEPQPDTGTRPLTTPTPQDST
ncbi:hypothetical protein ACYBSK_18970 [Streptomyces sp. BYX5S]